MAYYYCLGSVTTDTGTFNDSIKLQARDRSHALSLAKQELNFKYRGARVRIMSAVNIGQGAGSGTQGR